jgi:hypothetical protein
MSHAALALAIALAAVAIGLISFRRRSDGTLLVACAVAALAVVAHVVELLLA